MERPSASVPAIDNSSVGKVKVLMQYLDREIKDLKIKKKMDKNKGRNNQAVGSVLELSISDKSNKNLFKDKIILVKSHKYLDDPNQLRHTSIKPSQIIRLSSLSINSPNIRMNNYPTMNAILKSNNKIGRNGNGPNRAMCVAGSMRKGPLQNDNRNSINNNNGNNNSSTNNVNKNNSNISDNNVRGSKSNNTTNEKVGVTNIKYYVNNKNNNNSNRNNTVENSNSISRRRNSSNTDTGDSNSNNDKINNKIGNDNNKKNSNNNNNNKSNSNDETNNNNNINNNSNSHNNNTNNKNNDNTNNVSNSNYYANNNKNNNNNRGNYYYYSDSNNNNQNNSCNNDNNNNYRNNINYNNNNANNRNIKQIVKPSISPPATPDMFSRLGMESLVASYKARIAYAYKNRRIFTIYGCFPPIRQALLSRGWLQKLVPGQLPKVQHLPEYVLLQNARTGNDYETALISKMLYNYPSFFIWQPKDKNDLHADVLPLRNRVRRAGHLDFSTKVGLIGCAEHGKWYKTDGLSGMNHPRFYRVSTNSDERDDFIDDYRRTQCRSLLRILVENINRLDELTNPIQGTVNPNILQFATTQVERQLDNESAHSTLDTDDPVIENSEWNNFICSSAAILFRRNRFKAKGLDLKPHAETAKNLLAKLDGMHPDYKWDGYRNLWIVKPGFQSCGYGILLKSSLDDILRFTGANRGNQYIVQKYIGK